MINYVDLANSYDGEWLSTSSADKIKRYLDAFMKLTLAQIKVDGFNLDIKDYFGKEKETRMQDGPALMAALHTAQNEFINAWIDVVITKCD